MNIKSLKRGDSKYNLYLIRGLNSENNFSEWALENLNFPGNILGVEWNCTWEGWNLVEDNSSNKILSGITNFILGYLNVCHNADTAGRFLAEKVNYKSGTNNYIFAHSMGTRAAFTYLKFLDYSFDNNQVFLFNGAVPHSVVSHNFNSYSNKAKNGIYNFYNPDDPLLYVLAAIRSASTTSFQKVSTFISRSDFVKKRLNKYETSIMESKFVKENEPNLNEIALNLDLEELSKFFEPVGLSSVETIQENYSLKFIQGKNHSIDNIFSKILNFDKKNNKFEIIKTALECRKGIDEVKDYQTRFDGITNSGKKLLKDLRESVTTIKKAVKK